MPSKVRTMREFEIPDEVIEVVIEMAGYGIGYWADWCTSDRENRKLTVHVYEDDETFTVTYEDLAEALVEVGTRNSGNFVDEYAKRTLLEIQDGEEFPGGDVDADLADVLVQIAFYGEVIYG